MDFFSIFPSLTVTCDLTKFFTSSSETLPALCDPGISCTLAPSSLANFLTFGLADFVPLSEVGVDGIISFCLTNSCFSTSTFFNFSYFIYYLFFSSVLFSNLRLRMRSP